ncbi:GHKL domain-containing protein [Lacihabitans sp. LS3-19]|uniref:sensor histidine kinase n=1 Tax=Lacihabitans sp. LS3-19 TaxID=2487335 RepID=UPI0020CE1A24|nr:ATP-binding protein [Lacihabitans sp. LS3-19]MCP9770234.1 GHKL domain-containing protein [Lacihabitans sp. LS3-19]
MSFSYWFVLNSWSLQDLIHSLSLVAIPFTLSWYLSKEYAFTSKDLAKKLEENLQLSEEKQQILATQNETLEKQVTERTFALNNSLENLKATQAQLIQSEKMASLGELTAGIAHEIQNPLNFVNNFSEVTEELVEELEEEGKKGQGKRDKELEKELISDIKDNLKKINHHGNRASSIVKGMLEHSRASPGKKELTDINALADEYLKLSYHGLRAKDSNFNSTIETHFDENLPKIAVVPQDFGRVLLNIINNAFYVVKDVLNPLVGISTKLIDNNVVICIKDNGAGMNEATKVKIFQPFFTTKPTGKGTGLGLSLAYDIVKAHGGEITVESKEKVGTEFIIKLPIS